MATVAASSQACLYCKRRDTGSGFMYNYDYCPENDQCIENPGLYINKNSLCSGSRMAGYTIDIKDTCEAIETTCPGFVSDSTKVGVRT